MPSVRKKKIVLVTGPPNNGRDDYILKALPELQKTGKIGYHHVFDYMLKIAPACGIRHLTRENVFDISTEKLDEIRDKAFSKVINKIKTSSNDIEIVSTPNIFKTDLRGGTEKGKVEGLTVNIMKRIKPDLTIFLIDDLLAVRKRAKDDDLRVALGLSLKDIAEWREESLKLVKDYIYGVRPSRDFMIFAKHHPVSTFVDSSFGSQASYLPKLPYYWTKR